MDKKYTVTFMMAILLLSFILSACVNTNMSTDDNSKIEAPDYDDGSHNVNNGEKTRGDSVELSIIVPGEPNMNAENDRIFAEIEKRTNTKLTIISCSWDSFYDNVNLMASTGDLPDIVCCIDYTNKTLLDNWIKNGIIIPFNDEMKAAAPDIVKQYEEVEYYKELLVDGQIYFQPVWFRKKAFPNRGLFHVRKDILDQLGVELPDTLDEIYSSMKIMKEKLGIYGLVYDGNLHFSGIAGAFGIPYNGWLKDENGDYVYANVQPDMLEALKWVRKLYKENLVDPESPILVKEQAEQRYFTGKAGYIIFNGGAHITRYADSIKLENPKGEEWVLPAPAGPEGKRGYVKEPGFSDVSVITSNADDPVAAARFMNFLVSEEGQKLTVFGIKGIHYTEDSDGNIIINEKERIKDGKDHWDEDRYHQLAAPFVSWVDQDYQDWWSFYEKGQSYINWYRQMLENQGKYQIENEIMVASTPKWASFAQANADLWKEYSTRIILGEGDVDQIFHEFVEKWNEAGGLEASREMNEMAKALKGERK